MTLSPLHGLRVLVSGAGIAGPAIAYWLNHYGCAVTVVETASRLRRGGQAVDIKGETHRTVLERMGILDDVRARQTGGTDETVIDAHGRCLAVIPGEFTGGDVEIARSDLSEILYRRTAVNCVYRFGDSITSITETPTEAQVTFERAEAESFDVVVGADGIHSRVRRLVFGPDEDYVRFLDHYYAFADVTVAGNMVTYNEPGRTITVGGPGVQTFFVFRSPELTYDQNDPEQLKRILHDAYAGGGWRTGELLHRLAATDEIHLDSLSRVDCDHYFQGRVVLLGDAAYGNTLGGFGTGLALVGSYVLAGELAATQGSHRAAFTRYEQLLRPYAAIARFSNAGPFLAPRSRLRIHARNLIFRWPLLLKAMLWLTDTFATRIDLPDYADLDSPDPGRA